MSVRDRDRISLLREVHEGVLGAAEASQRLGISARHFRRMRRRWEEEGDPAVVHRARGHPSNRQLSPGLRVRALEMADDPLYSDFGPTLLAEHLERDARGGRVHASTLRGWLLEAGLWEVQPLRRRHRRRRPRSERGEKWS